MTRTNRAEPPSVRAQIISAISGGLAETRVDLAKHLQLAPSTVSVHVHDLLAEGVLSEEGQADSTGGRPAKILRLLAPAGHLLVAELGGTHARLGLADLTGKLLATVERPINIEDGPDAVFDTLTEYFGDLEADYGHTSARRGVCVGLPGPVDVAKGRVETPSRMPGWNHYPAGRQLRDRLGTHALIENDANLLALGQDSLHPGLSSSITVKAGTGIGAGLVIGGALHHGATGMAGDLSHARLPDAGDILCACGNTGCLETVASGAALVREMRATGYDVTSLSEIIELANNGDGLATSLVRGAGRHLGEMLCPIVGFTNPQAVYLGGLLSTLELFVASVRSQLYDGSHPAVTKNLIIDRTGEGPDLALIGGARLLAQTILAESAR